MPAGGSAEFQAAAAPKGGQQNLRNCWKCITCPSSEMTSYMPGCKSESVWLESGSGAQVRATIVKGKHAGAPGVPPVWAAAHHGWLEIYSVMNDDECLGTELEKLCLQ